METKQWVEKSYQGFDIGAVKEVDTGFTCPVKTREDDLLLTYHEETFRSLRLQIEPIVGELMAWHVRKNGEMRGYDFVFAIDKRDIVVECVSDNGKHIEMYVYVDNYFESNLTKALDQKQLAILRQVYKMICAWITESSAYRLQMVLGEKEISSFQTMK